MTTVTLSPARATRATAIGVVGFALALTAAAQVAVPIPGTPVPFTLQPLVVVLAGLWLGPRAAAASMVLYLAAGAAGLPVFAAGGAGVAHVLGPTGGYLIAQPAAAFVTGWLGARATSYGARALAACAGILVLYLGGLAQLAVLTGSLERATLLGVRPFVVLDVVKAHVAAALVSVRGGRAHA